MSDSDSDDETLTKWPLDRLHAAKHPDFRKDADWEIKNKEWTATLAVMYSSNPAKHALDVKVSNNSDLEALMKLSHLTPGGKSTSGTGDGFRLVPGEFRKQDPKDWSGCMETSENKRSRMRSKRIESCC